MEPQNPTEQTSTERLSLEAGIGSLVGALGAGVLAILAMVVTGSNGLALLSAALVAGGVGWWSRGRAKRHLQVVDAINAAVDGLAGGSSLTRLDETDVDSSFAPVVRTFNRLFEMIGQVTTRVLGVVHGIESLPERLTATMRRIQESADAQEEAVEETASLIANINSSMKDINEQIEKLQRLADESASSILQMGSSVEEVARNSATLHESVEVSTSSVHEMGVSIKQVAESAEQVGRIAEETAASMFEMDRVVQEVNGHAAEAAELTEKVSEGAERGSKAVSDTIGDIERIHARTSEARDTLGKLVGRISEIGGVLEVIGEINDETNLLSLNAAIIAAQAGEQGKAFLVVANHVKTLAKRTTASTKDIEKLVEDVQHGSGAAVSAMNAGIEAIEQGVTRSRSAGGALGDILTSSREAFDRVQGIARATDEQSRSSKLVSKAAQETSSQVQQISSAMTEQANVSEQMLQNAEAALDACKHVHRSTDEQRETGRYITESVSSITEKIRVIRESAEKHATASESASEAVLRVLGHAQKSGEQVPEVQSMLSQLSESARVIVAELSRFEGSGSGFDE